MNFTIQSNEKPVVIRVVQDSVFQFGTSVPLAAQGKDSRGSPGGASSHFLSPVIHFWMIAVFHLQVPLRANPKVQPRSFLIRFGEDAIVRACSSSHASRCHCQQQRILHLPDHRLNLRPRHKVHETKAQGSKSFRTHSVTSVNTTLQLSFIRISVFIMNNVVLLHRLDVLSRNASSASNLFLFLYPVFFLRLSM